MEINLAFTCPTVYPVGVYTSATYEDIKFPSYKFKKKQVTEIGTRRLSRTYRLHASLLFFPFFSLHQRHRSVNGELQLKQVTQVLL